MAEKVKLPYYSKLAQVTVGLLALFYILKVSGEILVPFIFSGILAILLNPLVNFFHRLGIKRILAILIAILVLFLVVFGIFFFIGAQVSMFRDALPELKQKAATLFQDGVNWFSSTFNVDQSRISQWIDTKKSEGLEGAGSVVGSTLLSITSALVMVFLIPVYIFLILLYKPLLLNFFRMAFPDESQETVARVLFSSRTLVQSYLIGLLIEMLIVAVLDSVALLIIGVDYAIVLGVIGALLNLIPYVGGLIAIALPVIMAFITGTPLQAFFVVLAYALIQLIDNNYLVPVIVASKVKINALVSIIVVLIGGALWGVAGMFLAIPLTAIIKVVFDHVPALKAFGYLLGDAMPHSRTHIFDMPEEAKQQVERNRERPGGT